MYVPLSGGGGHHGGHHGGGHHGMGPHIGGRGGWGARWGGPVFYDFGYSDCIPMLDRAGGFVVQICPGDPRYPLAYHQMAFAGLGALTRGTVAQAPAQAPTQMSSPLTRSYVPTQAPAQQPQQAPAQMTRSYAPSPMQQAPQQAPQLAPTQAPSQSPSLSPLTRGYVPTLQPAPQQSPSQVPSYPQASPVPAPTMSASKMLQTVQQPAQTIMISKLPTQDYAPSPLAPAPMIGPSQVVTQSAVQPAKSVMQAISKLVTPDYAPSPLPPAPDYAPSPLQPATSMQVAQPMQPSTVQQPWRQRAPRLQRNPSFTRSEAPWVGTPMQMLPVPTESVVTLLPGNEAAQSSLPVAPPYPGAPATKKANLAVLGVLALATGAAVWWYTKKQK